MIASSFITNGLCGMTASHASWHSRHLFRAKGLACAAGWRVRFMRRPFCCSSPLAWRLVFSRGLVWLVGVAMSARSCSSAAALPVRLMVDLARLRLTHAFRFLQAGVRWVTRHACDALSALRGLPLVVCAAPFFVTSWGGVWSLRSEPSSPRASRLSRPPPGDERRRVENHRWDGLPERDRPRQSIPDRQTEAYPLS